MEEVKVSRRDQGGQGDLSVVVTRDNLDMSYSNRDLKIQTH